MNTVPAAARPMLVRNGMPTIDSADSAISTVRPAKTTAEPGGADRAADRLLPVVGVVQLGAVARQDEQRVVDADGQTDHGGQDRGRGADGGEGGGDADAEHAEADADQRGEDRQAGRDQRAEGDDQHEQGDADADQLALAAGLDHGLHAGAVGLGGQPVVAGGVERRRAASAWVAGSTSATDFTS